MVDPKKYISTIRKNIYEYVQLPPEKYDKYYYSL